MGKDKRSKKVIKVIKRAKGVTMLALVVTIIVLLILAAITLSLAVGENGIIKRAKLARDKAKNASIQEEEAMNLAADEIDNAGSGGSGGQGGEGTCPGTEELENTIKKLQSTIANLEQQLAAERANKTALEQQIASLNNQIAALNSELNSKKEQIADLQGQVSSKNQELARKDETIRNLESTVASLNSQIEELNRQVETLKSKQATGNVLPSEVLAGKTFSNSNGVGLVGTMVNSGAINATLNAGQSYVIPAGYTLGGEVTAASIASQTQGTATANNLSKGATAWVNGVKITGNGADVDNAYESGVGSTNLEMIKGYTLSFSSTVSNGTNLSCTLTLYKDGTSLGSKTYKGSVYSLSYTNPVFTITDNGHRILVNIGYNAGSGYGNFSFTYLVDGINITTFTSEGGEYTNRNTSYTFPKVIIYDNGIYKQMD